MSSKEYLADHDKEFWWEKLCFLFLCLACLVRIYCYLFPKDLWLDESMIALAIDRASWAEIFRGQFIYNQSCPLFFAVIGKLLNEYTSYSPHVLYFLPTVAGMLLFVLLLKLCRIYEKSSLLAFICIALAAACKMPLYYSSEFKQYIFEGLVSIFLLMQFMQDFHRETFRDRILSYKYPLLFSSAFLISTPSVFVSAGIFTAMFLYMLRHEQGNVLHRLWNLCFRYVVFLFVCLTYYFFFLKNDAIHAYMYTYWKNMFIPHDITAWPAYIGDVIMPLLAGMFTVAYLKSIFHVIVALSFISGCYFMYKRNRYEFAACIFPFVFAIIAAFGIYPPGRDGLIGARLSFYLFPIIIFIASTGLFYISRKIFASIQKKYTAYAAVFSACLFIICVNVNYLVSGMAYQQTFSLFNTIHAEKKEGDLALVYSLSEPALLYWELIHKKKFDYAVLQSDIFTLEEKNIEAALPQDIFSHRKLFIVYSNSWDDASDTMHKLFLAHGYQVESTKKTRAELQKISK